MRVERWAIESEAITSVDSRGDRSIYQYLTSILIIFFRYLYLCQLYIYLS